MMKIFCVLICLFFLHVEAQRRTQTRQEITNAETPVRGRGRSRFTNTENEYTRPSDSPSRRIPSRRKQEPVTLEPIEKPNYPAPLSSTPNYAVEELIDEGGATPKSKALPEPNYEPQFISSKSTEADSQFVEKGTSPESSGEKFSAELDIPTVKLDTDKGSLFREDVEDILPKSNGKAVPITRNNVRISGTRTGTERRVDVRNGGSRLADRGSRNGNSRNTHEQNIPSSRSASSRSRGENNISSSRKSSLVEDSAPISRQDVTNEIPSPKVDSSSNTNIISESVKDEDELRKEIVRNSVPKLPSPIGVGAILSEPSPSKKTIKKTLRNRVNINSRNEESPIAPRGRSSQKIVENFETISRAAPVARTVEEYSPPPRGRSTTSPSEDAQSLRGRTYVTPKTVEVITGGRSRTRATRKPTDAPQVATVPSRRNGRRRPDSSTTSAPSPRRGPSVFSAHEDTPSTRSRTGRRIETVIPKAQIDQTQNSRAGSSRGRTRGIQVTTDQLESSSNKRQNFKSRNEDQVIRPSRQRFNPRSPLNIDESKLEVLPLFEGETKIISEVGRKPNQLGELISPVTENGNRVIKPPEVVTPSISTRSDVSTSSKVSTVKVSRRKPPRKTEIKETVVISQVTEVTSKRTITRKPILRPGGKRPTTKKSVEPKSNGLTSSEENISDSDNYPEPFKALIQSKKQVKESRPSNVPVEDTKTKKIEKLVSSSEAPRSVLATPNEPTKTTTYPIKYGEDSENEVHPKTPTTPRATRPTKKRLSLSLKNLETKNKKATTARKPVSGSTLAPAKEPKEHKFHSKFNSVTKNNVVPMPKPFNSSAAKGLAFNRKSKDSEKYSINKTRNAIEIGNNRGQYTQAPLHKSSRYSSRYRSSGSSRSAPRTSTAPPAYIPTIPSVRSYSSTVKPKEDPELGIEYITFDIPSRSISSANLIKGDYQASEDANSNSLVSTPPSSVNTLNSTTNKPENTATTTEMTASSSTTVESVSTEESSSSSTVIPDNVISSTAPVPSTTLPSISELLNGKIVQAYNSLVNNTSPKQESTTQVESNEVRTTTFGVPSITNTVTVAPPTVVTTGIPSFLSTLITTLQSIGTTRFPVPITPTTQGPFRFSSTYRAPLSTKSITPTVPTTTTVRSSTTTVPSTTIITTTTRPLTTSTVPSTTTIPPTTTNPTTTPRVITREVEDSSTPPPFTSKPAVASITGKGLLSTTVFPYFNSRDFPLLSFFSTERPRRTNAEESSTINTSTTPQTTTLLTTTSQKIETASQSLEELLKKPIDSIKPKKKLTEQQKQDLETIRQLEKEQAAILKQLSLLTNLNLNNLGNGQSNGNLANRIISLAKERDSRKAKPPKATTTTTKRTTTITTTTESTTTMKAKSEDEAEKERMRQIESLIKLLNMNGVTPSPQKETTYGTTNDAILAALLKERGIGPSTPKQLADQLENSGFFTQTNEITSKPTTKPTRRTTKKPKPTTQPTRGPLLQRLNWLLDAFAPPPTKAPTRKPKTTTKKPKPKVEEEDILTNEPSHITPVVSPPPQTKKGNTVSQEDIQKLIKQLEAIQKDPSSAKNLDLTSFNNLQNLNKDNVQVFMRGSSGVSERETTRPFTRAISQKSKGESPSLETTTVKRKSSARAVRTSTFSPTSVSNSLLQEDDDVVPTPSVKGRATIPPVRLRPVTGVSDEAGSMVRGRLLSAAVNVTRAISGFLGSAFQDAVKSLGRSLSSGSLPNFVGSSSIPRNSEVASLDQDYP